ncbi:MAG: hypothetical protein WD423_03740 [Rhodothermales bacterium]
MSDRRLKLGFLLPVLLWLVAPVEGLAQFQNKPLAVGNLVNVYSEIGGEREGWFSGRSLRWPRIMQQDNLRVGVMWMGARNVEHMSGETFDYMVAHVGPRVGGAGELFPMEFRTVSRFEPPEVIVQLPTGDRVESLDYFPDNDEVDPNLPADRMIYTKAASAIGLTYERRVYAYDQSYNDNYHIQEFVLTNTGDQDGDGEQDVEQTLEGVYLHFQKRYQMAEWAFHPGGSDGWGANVMNDVVGDGMEDYDVDFRAQYTWLGNAQNSDAGTFDEAGYPKLGLVDNSGWRSIPEAPGDTTGRLTVPQFIGTVTLHADAGADDGSDDPTQPSSTGHIDSDHPLLSGNDAFDSQRSEQDYNQVIAVGHMFPHHADIVDVDGDFLTYDGTPQLGKAGGYSTMFSYGPYSLGPGEDVRIVLAEAVDGLDQHEAELIGSAFKELANHRRDQMSPDLATTRNITYRGETLSKNGWLQSGRDSLFQTFNRVLAAYGASSGMTQYGIPKGPMPPSSFRVIPGEDEVQIGWDVYPNAGPIAGWELYRSRTYYWGPVENGFRYDCIAGCPGTPALGPDAREFNDALPGRGVEQFYYLQAVASDVTGAGSPATPDGVRLKSNRYWTQTWDGAAAARGPGQATSDFVIVPNPLNVAATGDIRWPDREDKVAFLDIPGRCTIRIFTERGDLVKTIEHTTGTGDEAWNLTTDSQQVIVSGVYIVVVDNHETGERVIKKFVVIR